MIWCTTMTQVDSIGMQSVQAAFFNVGRTLVRAGARRKPEIHVQNSQGATSLSALSQLLSWPWPQVGPTF